jgi:hypothetical protein
LNGTALGKGVYRRFPDETSPIPINLENLQASETSDLESLQSQKRHHQKNRSPRFFTGD